MNIRGHSEADPGFPKLAGGGAIYYLTQFLPKTA